MTGFVSVLVKTEATTARVVVKRMLVKQSEGKGVGRWRGGSETGCMLHKAHDDSGLLRLRGAVSHICTGMAIVRE
jgi:hypothetical protein